MASNYKIMEGTRKNSKLYVFASKLYLADRPKGKGKGSGSGSDSGSFIYVRCKDYKVGDGCSARGYIENNKFVVTIPVHTCGINQEYIRQLRLKSVLKNEAEKVRSPSRQSMTKRQNKLASQSHCPRFCLP